MTEAPQALPGLARIEAALAAGPAPGPWTWWTSCSFRRLSSDTTGGDGDVLCGTVQLSDNHPDIHASAATMEYIAACDPDTIRSILALIAQQQRNLNAALADAERYRHLRDHSNDCALCAVNIRDWSEEFEGQAMLEMLEGTYLDDAIDTARAALAPGAAGSTTKDTK